MIPYDVWAEIDLSAIDRNVRSLKAVLDRRCRLMAVVKADGYGHGAVPVARQVMAAGADGLAVARLAEALELRNGGIRGPILIFGHTYPDLVPKLIHHDLTQTVSSYKAARALSEGAQSAGRRLRVHVKIDTGMGRLGVLGIATGEDGGVDCAAGEIEAICRLKGIDAEGVYTHFATADSSDKTAARRQLELFAEILERLRQRGITFAVRHAANSAAAMDMPETHLDMVRIGISIYGHYPSGRTGNRAVKLVPAMSLRARIVHLKRVGAGFRVSYGWSARTREKTVLATVPVGYADGFSRTLSTRGFMLVRGCRAPVIGRVCMDHTMLDVGHIPGVSCGEPVLVFGKDEYGEIPVEVLAGALGTIHYEVLSGISSRIPRVYRK